MGIANKYLYHIMHYKISMESLKSFLFCVYMIGIFLVYIMPYFKYTIPYVPAALLMLFCLPFLFFSGSQQKYVCVLIITSAILALLYFTIKMPGDMKNSVNEFIRNLRFYIPACLGYYAVNHLNHKAKSFMIFTFLLLSFYIIVNTIAALFINPMLSRELAEGVTISDYIASYRLQNIGGYEFSYMMGMLTLLFVFCFMQSTRKANKWIALILAALCYYYIVEAQYTILLLLTTGFSVYILFSRQSNSMVKVLLISILILLFLNLGTIFDYLSLHLKQQMLAMKFSWLADFIAGNRDRETLHSRPGLYLNAFLDFCKSPIWGSSSESGDNAHSYVLGLLSNCGLLGICSYLTIFFYTMKHMENSLIHSKKDTFLFRCACWYSFILSIVNPIGTSFEITILLYFLIPVWISITKSIAFDRSNNDRIPVKEMGRKT